MSSPFAAFRKNQKMMMAILGVLVMIAFLILPPLLDYDWNASVGAEVIVTTRYGAVSQQDFHKMAQRRNLANQFLYNLRLKANLPPFDSYFGRPTEMGLVDTMLLAKKAEEMGLEIPDERVVAVINELTEDSVDEAGIGEITRQLRVQQTEIMNALRYELAAQQYLQLQYSGVQISTPFDRWQQFESLNREMSVEVIPLPVDNYVAKVKNPTDAQLQPFFEKHKDTETTVRSGVPGFEQPRKAAFQYFRIKLSDFTSQVTVTDEEIAAAYERDKEFYPYVPPGEMMTNPFVNPDDLPPSDDVPPADDSVTPATDAEAPPDTAPAGETPPAESPTPSEPAPDAKPEAPQSSTRRSPFHFAAMRFQDSQATAAEGETGTAEGEAGTAEGETGTAEGETGTAEGETGTAEGETGAASETQPVNEQPASAETPATELPAEEATPPTTGETPPVDEPPFSAEDEPLAPADLVPSNSLQDLPLPLPSRPRYQPLSAVRERIRAQLAAEKARPLMDKVVSDLSREMRKYESKYRGWASAMKQDSASPAPTPLDFADLARKFGVEAKQTPLLAADALLFSEEYTLGKSFIGQGMSQRDLVAIVAYNSLSLFQVQESHDVQGDLFLFWKSEEKEGYVPSFDEVRDEVLDAWKLEEARQLALEDAKKLADEARQSKKSLREAFAGRADLPVTAPRPFSWKFGGFMFGQQEIPIQLSTVEGVSDAGDDFMKAVYSLDIGEIGVALDATKSTAYLIRLENSTPELSVLHTMFLTTPYSSYFRAGMDAAQKRQADWRQELDQDAEVRWLRAPQQM